ncbi:Pycsar system effector family protein [Longispora sp. NPDC051575]|uniref:Pycsar system effector family protein n=1 Tax=Longispora sp. NPDC051575 TaxID=3154943 RepID=UPI0034494B37
MSSRRPPAVYPTAPEPVDFAWRVHGTQESWTAKADVKASIMLAFEGALLFFVLSGQTWPAPGVPRAPWLPLAEGCVAALLLVAVVATTSAILPLTGTQRELARERRRNLIYFGHVRLWSPAELSARLGTLTPAEELRMVSRQVVVMSRLNWWKHRCLQVSVALTVSSLVILTTVAGAHTLG